MARMVPYRMLPSIQWIFLGDPGQPQIAGHWRKQRCRNGLYVQGSLSSYLPEAYVHLTEDHRSLCPILKDYRKRLREADDRALPSLIEEGRRIFTCLPRHEHTIVVTNAKRRKICRTADRAWRVGNPDEPALRIQSEDLGPIWLYVGARVNGEARGT